MSPAEKFATSIIEYFNFNRQIDHTKALIEGAMSTGAIVVTETEQFGDDLKKQYPGLKTIGIHNIRFLHGCKNAIVLDNQVVFGLLLEMFDVCNALRARNAFLIRKILKIEKM